MNKLERKLDQTKNKISGAAKQAAGKISGDEVLELKGKIQSSKADLQKKTDVDDLSRKIKKTADQGKASVEHKVKEVQQSVAKKINNSIDEHAKKKTK